MFALKPDFDPIFLLYRYVSEEEWAAEEYPLWAHGAGYVLSKVRAAYGLALFQETRVQGLAIRVHMRARTTCLEVSTIRAGALLPVFLYFREH